MTMTSPSADDLLESELFKARARLNRLQKNNETGKKEEAVLAALASPKPQSSSSSSSTAAADLWKRAQQAEDQLEFIGLERNVAKILGDFIVNNNNFFGDGADAAAGGGSEGGTRSTTLKRATETSTALGLILLQHSHNHNHQMKQYHHHGKSGQFVTALAQWYNSLYTSTRSMALNLFQVQLRKLAPEYPSNERSSALVADALLSCDVVASESLDLAARCLVELQVIHDAVQLQQQQVEEVQQQRQRLVFDLPTSTSSSWRLDLVDELCKPLAERLRFHFLEEQTGIMTGEAGGTNNNLGNLGNNAGVLNNNEHQTSTKMDRLPEWLFRYLRETVENHGVYSQVIMEGVQTLIDSTFDSLVVQASMMIGDDDNNDDDDCDDGHLGLDENDQDPYKSTPGCNNNALDILSQLKQQYYYYSNSPTYFLREVARMARHALRAKSFFHHPDVVGSECRDRTIVLRGIEQLFLFDNFLDEKVKEGGGIEGGHHVGGGLNPAVLPPKMVDTFLSSNESLLKWWLVEERDGMVSMLHECAWSTLLSYQSENEKGGKDGESAAQGGDCTNQSQRQRQQQLYPPISQLFVALLHSARCKSNSFTSHHSQQMYISDVIAPLCSEYLDMVHAEAAFLRKSLLARPPSTSSTATPTVSVLRSSANLPSDEMLTSNTMEWASLITGTHLVARAVLLHPPEVKPRTNTDEEEHTPNILDRVGQSMEHLCKAMIEEYTSALVETIIMERAKLASYTMRAPFLLSEPPTRYDGDSPRRGQRDKDMSVGTGGLSLSPDLNDSIHVMTIAVKSCNAMMLKVKSMFESNGDGSLKKGAKSITNEPSIMLYYGCQSLHDALKFAISQKLLDIAIDPQGMTPEIYIGGARQFQHDVMTFQRLFQIAAGDSSFGGQSAEGIEPGPMERVAAASNLMSLDALQIQSIREALRALVVPSAGIGSFFGRRGLGDSPESEMDDGEGWRLNADDFYVDECLLSEGISMLEAKGFGALALDEALSIINRRC